MVEVPKIGNQRPSRRPTAMVPTSGAAPDGAFGEGGVEVAAGIGRAGEALQKQADVQLDRANKLWFLQAESSIAAKQLDIESRAKQRKGRDAFGLHEETEKEFDEYISTVKTHNKSQRLGLEQIKLSRKTSMNRTVTGHVNNEYEQVETQESESYRSNLSNSASSHYEDPTRFGEDKLKFDAAVADEAERQGLASESKKAFTLANTTAFHVATLKRMLANEDHHMATQYFKQYGDEISEAAKERLQPAMKESSLRGDSQSATDQIMIEFGTWRERFAEAKKIADPEIRDATRTRLRQEMADEDDFKRDEAKQDQVSNLNIIDEKIEAAAGVGKDVSARDAIGPVEWTKMDLSERTQYSNYAAASTFSSKPEVIRVKQAHRTQKVGALWALWHKTDKSEFMKATTSSLDPDTKRYVPAPLNLELLKPILGETEYNRFKGYQSKQLEGAAKDKEDVVNDMVKQSLDRFDVTYSEGVLLKQADLLKEDPDAVAQIKLAQIRGREILRAYIQAQIDQLPPEKKQDTEEVQKIINAAWLDTDVDRVGSMFDSANEPFGSDVLPLFISRELAEKGVLVEDATTLSDGARKWLRDNYGIPASARYDPKTEEFFVKGKELARYLESQKIRPRAANGQSITGVFVGLDGRPNGEPETEHRIKMGGP